MMRQEKEEEPRGVPFTMRVCRCTRCGGILYSADGVRKGIGRTCWHKQRDEEEAWARLTQITGQASLFGAATPWDMS